LPFITANNIRQFYRLEGKAGAPVLMLSHSIGTDLGMWAPQIADLMPHFQVLRYDTRGHGGSDAPKGEYSVEMLGRDALALADALEIKNFAFCGLSMGGAVGQWLALNAPQRLTGLVLSDTSPQFGARANWEARIKAVKEGGMAAIADMVMQRFFSPATMARGDGYSDSVKSVFLATNPDGYLGCCAALRDVDHTARLREIQVPTLIIAGNSDVSTPWEGHGEILTREIPNAKVVRLPGAHLSNLERPRSFTAALLDFLQTQPGTDTWAAGLAVRRAMLGDAHVDRAISSTTDFNRDFQELITRYAWGTVWTRPGLDLRTRRLLALAIVASLGRWEEFAMHTRAGLAHELEPCDLKELLLQAAIYAGVPVANHGFQLAQEEITKIAGQ
jgi:3-oxoadipate enol-lactonase / 4-carboxymuconolactone decarboxylase